MGSVTAHNLENHVSTNIFRLISYDKIDVQKTVLDGSDVTYPTLFHEFLDKFKVRLNAGNSLINFSWSSSDHTNISNASCMFGAISSNINLYKLLSHVDLSDFGRKDFKILEAMDKRFNSNDSDNKVNLLKNKKHPFSDNVTYYFAKPLSKTDIKGLNDINPALVPKDKSLAKLFDLNKSSLLKWMVDHPYPVCGKDLKPL